MSNKDTKNNEVNVKSNEECPHCGSKKCHVHGKIERNIETGKSEVSYYECDNVQCRKVFINGKI